MELNSIRMKLRWIAAGLALGACGSEPGTEGTESSGDMTATATASTGASATDTQAVTDTDSASESDDGLATATYTATDTDTDTDADTDTDPDSGEPPVECPARDETVSAGFSITVDGMPIVVDYSEYFGVVELPIEWATHDDLPEIDGPCDVVDQPPGSLSLACIDTLGMSRAVTIELSASESLSTAVGPDPVHVWYIANDNGDMLEGYPDTNAHAFVVSTDQGIALAGIDGRYSIGATLQAAWPDWPEGNNGADPCDFGGTNPNARRTLAHVALEDGASADVYDGSVSDVGALRFLVELSTTISVESKGESQTVRTARWLLGAPR